MHRKQVGYLIGAILLTAMLMLAGCDPADLTETPPSSATPVPSAYPAGGAEPISAIPSAYPAETPNGEEEPTVATYPGKEQRNDEWLVKEANVEEIRLNVMESLPVQVSVTVRGKHPDGCTEIGHSVQTVTDHVIQLTVYSRRPKDAFCTQALVPYEQTFPLDLVGLSAGEYTVNVNGLTETLVLEAGMLATPQQD